MEEDNKETYRQLDRIEEKLDILLELLEEKEEKEENNEEEEKEYEQP